MIERGNKSELEQEYLTLYSKWESIVRSIKKRSAEYDLKECAIACIWCDSMLCWLKVLKLRKEVGGITEI